MNRLKPEEFALILDILERITRDHKICHHEALIWLQIEMHLSIELLAKERPSNN